MAGYRAFFLRTYCKSCTILLDLSLFLSMNLPELVKSFRNILFYFFLLSLIGLGSDLLARTEDGFAFFLSESKEISEEEEGGCKTYFFGEEKIKQAGSGGSGLEEKESDLVQQPCSPYTYFLSSLLFFSYYYPYFSIKEYYNHLLQTLYLQRLYILFHCTKAYLF